MNETTRDSKDESVIAYLSIILVVTILFVVNIGIYARFLESFIPMGDPFTYTIGLFRLVDGDYGSIPETLQKIVSGAINWYWMVDIWTTLLSPILIKEPYLICLINYSMTGIATALFFQLGRVMGLGAVSAYIMAMLIWVFPINYTYITHSSVPVLALDAMFNAALLAAVSMALAYALYPQNTRYALFSGLFAGLAIWSRGNSIPVVLMVLAAPGLWLLYAVWYQKDKKAFLNLAIALSLLLAMAGWFYYANWTPLNFYYTHHYQFAARHSWNIDDAKKWLINMPGFFYYRHENSVLTVLLSLLNHVFVTTVFVVFLVKRHCYDAHTRFIFGLTATTGALIYWVTFAVNIVMFTDPIMKLYNVILIYRPMLIGIVVSASGLIFFLGRQGYPALKLKVIPYFSAALVFGAIFFSYYQIPHGEEIKLPEPRTVEHMASIIDRYAEGDEGIAFLWRGIVNSSLIQYYRRKNGLPDIKVFGQEHLHQILSPTRHDPENRAFIRAEIRRYFEQASLIVIPEYYDYYQLNVPYALYQFRDLVAESLNDPASPRLVVRHVVLERPCIRLLFVQRQELARGRGHPMTLPYVASPPGSLVRCAQQLVERHLAAAGQTDAATSKPPSSLR